MTAAAIAGSAQITPVSQMEKLDRGLVVIPIGTTRTLSWRFLGTDDEGKTTFNILRDGETIVENRRLSRTGTRLSTRTIRAAAATRL